MADPTAWAFAQISKHLDPNPHGSPTAQAKRKIELIWRELVEDLDEQRALEVVMDAIISEAKGRVSEAGHWNHDELQSRLNVLEHAADEMGKLI